MIENHWQLQDAKNKIRTRAKGCSMDIKYRGNKFIHMRSDNWRTA